MMETIIFTTLRLLICCGLMFPVVLSVTFFSLNQVPGIKDSFFSASLLHLQFHLLPWKSLEQLSEALLISYINMVQVRLSALSYL